MVSQYRAIWSVPGGGTGYSTFTAWDISDTTDAQAFADAVATFMDEVLAIVPTTVSVSFDPEVRVMDTGTGALEAVFPVTAPASDTGGSSATYAAGAGGRVDWLTTLIVSGRRLRGRTFVVPLTGFEANGTLSTASITALTDGAEAYLSAMAGAGIEPVVWHRPVNGANGGSASISGFSVPDKSALLRSRRD